MPKKTAPEGALFVRLPAAAVEKLDRAADALGVRKKDLVAGLVGRYVDPDSHRGLDALGALASHRGGPAAPDAGVSRGSYSFRAYDPPEVMNVEQAADFLQIEVAVVRELVEAGKLPGRKLGAAWRFSRAALVAWLSEPEKKR
ncbi:MAG TPA: helix-turn-helix domain-containing protein [Polyangia bacterium]|jgi:excisionase family DNA binding protein|nr:helix-turn-helix domain-containing protein [Polyangia bacterium]